MAIICQTCASRQPFTFADFNDKIEAYVKRHIGVVGRWDSLPKFFIIEEYYVQNTHL